MKPRVIAILLFLCLVVPLGTTFTWLQVQKKAVKREIKWRMIAGMDRNELVQLSFSNAEAETELDWEHSKEFEYRGQMYDVVAQETRNDSIFFWCWWDHEETKLNQELNGLLANAMGDNPQKKEQQNRLINYFKSLYFSENSPFKTSASNAVDTGLSAYLFAYVSHSWQPPSPPPKGIITTLA